jgi:hypothetical protein
VILELLTLGGLGAEERAVARDQVRALEVVLAVDQEVLLLGAGSTDHARHPCIGAEDLEDAHRLLAERIHRAQEGCLVVERLAGPRDERSGDAERDRAAVAVEEDGAGAVPRGVAAGLEGRADAARGEGLASGSP